jgi:hypothetical protein
MAQDERRLDGSLPTPAPVTRHRNGSASVTEPVFAPFSTPAAVKRQRWGWSKIGLPDAGASVTMAVEDGKIGLPDASVFIALMPGIPDAVRTLLAPRNYSGL